MKLLLIATTALVCVGSLAMAGTLPEREYGSSRSRPSANEEFLCNHGFTIRRTNEDDSFYFSWVRAAVPIIGTGKPVNEITVDDGHASGFEVAIYSSHRNRPKGMLVESHYYVHHRCGRVSVPISPILLRKGTRYWIVQEVSQANSSQPNSILWVYDHKRSHGALSQHGTSFCSSVCSSTPRSWMPITGGVPYARAGYTDGVSDLNRSVRIQSNRSGSASPALAATRHGREDSSPRSPP